MKKAVSILSAAFAVLSLMTFAENAQAQWGSIKGKIVLDGDVPEPKIVFEKGANVKDKEVCAKEDFVSDELVIDSETKGIKNIFIYLRRAPKVHPDLKESAEKEVVFDQKGCRFVPHTLLVRTDQVVKVKSADPVAHNTHTFTLRNTPVNILIKPNEREGIPITLRSGESLPMQVKCDLHPHMLAYWLILDHPYAAVTGKDGSFEIKNLPAGKHEFRVWHEKVGYVEKSYAVTVEDGKVTELEPLKVPVSKFEG